MTDLKKIIDKAVSGGYKETIPCILALSGPKTLWQYYFDAAIFSHSFLKAFAIHIIRSNQVKKLFGYEIMPGKLSDEGFIKMVKEKLACELVLSEDRLKYLMRFVNGENN